jgi:predicted nucleic acid-binding protein
MKSTTMTSEPVLIAVDTNILIYAMQAGHPADDFRPVVARQLITRLHASTGLRMLVPVQVVLEFTRVVQRKLGLRGADVQASIDTYVRSGTLVPTDEGVAVEAVQLATAGGFQIFDAAIVAASRRAGCTLLLSEDMHDGRRIGDLTITNPFNPDNRAVIESLFAHLH